MIFNRSYIILCFFLILAGCGSRELSMRFEGQSELPLKTVRFSVNDSSRIAFLEQIRKFAESHDFLIREATVTPDKRGVSIQMWRKDLKVIGVNPFSPTEFRISFYYNSEVHVSNKVVMDLANSLSQQVTSIPGVVLVSPKPSDPTITETKGNGGN